MKYRRRTVDGIIQIRLTDKMFDALDKRQEKDLSLQEKFNDTQIPYSTQLYRIIIKVLSEE